MIHVARYYLYLVSCNLYLASRILVHEVVSTNYLLLIARIDKPLFVNTCAGIFTV